MVEKHFCWTCNNLAKINITQLYFVQVCKGLVESGYNLQRGQRWPATEAEENTLNLEAAFFGLF